MKEGVADIPIYTPQIILIKGKVVLKYCLAKESQIYRTGCVLEFLCL